MLSVLFPDTFKVVAPVPLSLLDLSNYDSKLKCSLTSPAYPSVLALPWLLIPTSSGSWRSLECPAVLAGRILIQAGGRENLFLEPEKHLSWERPLRIHLVLLWLRGWAQCRRMSDLQRIWGDGGTQPAACALPVSLGHFPPSLCRQITENHSPFPISLGPGCSILLEWLLLLLWLLWDPFLCHQQSMKVALSCSEPCPSLQQLHSERKGASQEALPPRPSDAGDCFDKLLVSQAQSTELFFLH